MALSARLRVRTGSRAGFVVTSEGSPIRIGRENGLELQFDPTLELDVSGTHARITKERNTWCVSDMDSRNGTYVNGRKIDRKTPLTDRDQIAFGAHGPIVEVRIVDPESTRDFDAPAPPPPRIAPHPTPTARLRAEVARRTRPWKWTLVAVAVGASAIIGVLVIRGRAD